ncbi:hypothetical protein Golax_014930 [Gossypium laxum]|uniref:Uncharacterized protein n=1 Tax=Gossypium laxum TaxID=34288 RepID=A0A7J8ZXN5_9ROSI|nr:hypothetical protein [Gossypium laxum]
MKARFGFDRWGLEGLDGNSLKAHFNGNRDGLVELFCFTISPDATIQNQVTRGLCLISWVMACIVSFGTLFGSSVFSLRSTFSHRGLVMIYFQPMSKLLQFFMDLVEGAFGVLRDWLKTYAVLSLGGLDGRLLGNDYVRCIDWLEDVTCLLDLKAYENLITILWNVWNSRNNAMFRGKEEDTRIVWERAISLGDDFRIFDLINAPLIPKTLSPQKRNKSPSYFFKINVDAAIVDDSVGLGVIAWDYDGT